MAFETLHGRIIRTGGFVPPAEIEIGQIWTDGKQDVRVTERHEDLVCFAGVNTPVSQMSCRMFQCHYYQVMGYAAPADTPRAERPSRGRQATQPNKTHADPDWNDDEEGGAVINLLT